MTVPLNIQEQLRSRAPGQAVLNALERLLEFDEHLLKVDANERSISHRFGMYLQSELPGHFVDCEYNRTGVDPKRIHGLQIPSEADDTDGKTVFPDVIAHCRGRHDGNYLVVEFKKSNSSVSRDFDLKKLRRYKGDTRLNYQYALFIELSVGLNPGIRHVDWVDA